MIIQQEKVVELSEIWHAIWNGKISIFLITTLSVIFSVLFALAQPNIYKASTLLAPVSSDNRAGGLAKMSGNLGGLASLAGISLGSSDGGKVSHALAIIKSRKFLEKFIETHQIAIPLMAVKEWDVINNELIFDEEIYNVSEKKWIREVSFPKKPKPSSWETFKALLDVLVVSQDKETGMITITIEHVSPVLATQWVAWLVEDINAVMRDDARMEAQKSIDFLNAKLEEIQISDMKSIFYQMIEEQTKNMMLTEVSKEFVFKTIEPANVPDEKDSPKRALIVAFGTLIGGGIAITFVVVRYFKNKEW